MHTSRFFLIVLLLSSALHAKIINFDNDPDLTQALHFDLERNGGIHKQADRKLAEKHYLAYLKKRDDLESSQKAIIYSQLGVLYTTAINVQKDEKPDYKKAKAYFERALKAEPKRIGYETLRARSMLPAVSHSSGMERLKARVEFYEYLASIDESEIRANWLRSPEPKIEETDSPAINQLRSAMRKGRKGYFEKEVERLLKLVGQLKYSHIYNATNCDARSLNVPEEGWVYILDHLSKTDTIERKIVQDAMKRKVDPVMNETLNLFLNDGLVGPESPVERIKDVVVRRRFIPSVSYAKERGTPFVFDLHGGTTVKSASYSIDDEEFHKGLNHGDLVWNGSLCTFGGIIIVGSVQDDGKKLSVKKKEEYFAYTIPDNIVLPYGLTLSSPTNMRWSVQVLEIMNEGIVILYGETNKNTGVDAKGG